MVNAVPSNRSSLQGRALAWSLGLHVLMVVVAALPVVRSALNQWQAAAQERAASVVPLLEPVEVAIVVPEVTAVEPPAAAPPPSFIRTDGRPESAPEAGQPKFISDRNTRAASESAPDPSAVENQPTQEGVDIPVVEVVRIAQSDGEDDSLPPSPDARPAAAAPAASAATSEAATAEAPESREAGEAPEVAANSETGRVPSESAPATTTSEPADNPNPSSLPDPVEERLALARESELRVSVDAPPSSRASSSRDTPALRDPEVHSRPPRPPRQPKSPETPPPAGFSGLRTPTRLRGTISNQGTSSVDAEDTPTGRYMKQVTTAIEKEWHRKRRLHQDFVTFGTIKLEFRVDPRGQVHDLTIKNRSGANAVMQDFTLNAVLDAQIPPMPAGLHEVLDREMLLISYDIIVY